MRKSETLDNRTSKDNLKTILQIAATEKFSVRSQTINELDPEHRLWISLKA